MTQTEVKAEVHQRQPVSGDAAIAKPKTTWEFNEDDSEVHQITTISLQFVDLPARELRRLARAAGEKVKVAVEILPQLEQMEFEE